MKPACLCTMHLLWEHNQSVAAIGRRLWVAHMRVPAIEYNGYAGDILTCDIRIALVLRPLAE